MRWFGGAVAGVLLSCLGCATVESELAGGRLYDACEIAENGHFPFGQDVSEFERVKEAARQQTVVEIEALDWEEEKFLGQPLLHDELVLYRMRVTLPGAARASHFDIPGNLNSPKVAIERSLPPLLEPDSEVAPPGPLKIPEPPKNPIYRPPPPRHGGGLIGAFVELVTLPATLIRVGVEVAVEIITLPIKVAADIFNGVRVRPSGRDYRAPTPLHANPIFADALLTEDEWLEIVKEKQAIYDKKKALYDEQKADRERRIAALTALVQTPCDLKSSNTCEVVRIRERRIQSGQPHGAPWFHLSVQPLLYSSAAAANAAVLEEQCYVGMYQTPVPQPATPLPYRTRADAERTRAALDAAKKNQEKRERAPTVRPGRQVWNIARPTFLWKAKPPKGIARAFAEASQRSVDELAGDDLVCRINIKHPRRWNERRGPDPIVRLAWGKIDIEGETVFGPDDARRFHILIHRVYAKKGDRFRITMGDRDGGAVEYMGIAVTDFDGVMPLKFDLSSYSAECRHLTPAATLRRAKSAVDRTERKLARLQRSVEKAMVTVVGGGFPKKARDRVNDAIMDVAAWLGPDHLEVERLLKARDKAQVAFDKRVQEKRKAVRDRATPVKLPLKLDRGVVLVDAKKACAPTVAERDRVDFFVPDPLEAGFSSACIDVLVLESQQRYRSVGSLKSLGLEALAEDGSEAPDARALVGDAKGWFVSKSASKGARVVLLASPASEDGKIIYLHRTKGTAFFIPRDAANDPATLDPVTLGATPLPPPPPAPKPPAAGKKKTP